MTMKMLDEVLRNPGARLYLQRRFRAERFDESFTPQVVKDEALRLLAEAEADLDGSGLMVAQMVYPAYADRKRQEGI